MGPPLLLPVPRLFLLLPLLFIPPATSRRVHPTACSSSTSLKATLRTPRRSANIVAASTRRPSHSVNVLHIRRSVNIAGSSTSSRSTRIAKCSLWKILHFRVSPGPIDQEDQRNHPNRELQPRSSSSEKTNNPSLSSRRYRMMFTRKITVSRKQAAVLYLRNVPVEPRAVHCRPRGRARSSQRKRNRRVPSSLQPPSEAFLCVTRTFEVSPRKRPPRLAPARGRGESNANPVGFFVRK